MKSEDKHMHMLILIFALSTALAWHLTSQAYTRWRPKVSEWAEISVPHQAVPIDIPKRITWRGVEYECTLVEREQP